MSHAYIFTNSNQAYARAHKLADNPADIIEVTNERFSPDDAEKNALTVDAVRGLSREAYNAPYGNIKALILPNADAMLQPAQNALLKILEEPPEFCVFLLIAQNPNTLLPTIRSRAEIVRTEAISEDEFITQTKQKYPELYAQTAEIMKNAFTDKISDSYRAIAYLIDNKDNKTAIFEILKCIYSLQNAQTSDIIKNADMLQRISKAEVYLASNCNYQGIITNLIIGTRENK